MEVALPKNRIQSIDILRGLVMLIMALDHVRDFFHNTAVTQSPLDLQTTTPILFFTRWVTHFCAPTFVFLSGVSAHLSGLRKSKKELAGFLIKRGFWLILVEVTVVTLGLTFNPLFNVIILQVIWAIGWSMILLGLLIRLPLAVIGTIGLLIIFGHNITDLVTLPKDGAGAILIKVFFTSFGDFLPIAPARGILLLYAILPWAGIMLAGYAIGYYFRPEIAAQRRQKILLITGSITILLFAVIRFINSYGDPSHWSNQPSGLYTFLSFINTSKYPPSLLYTCMTIGPALLFLALFENIQNRFTRLISVYGRVPFFYYILHFYTIHFLLVICFFASGYGIDKMVSNDLPFLFRPTTFGYSLPIVYIIWLAIITGL